MLPLIQKYPFIFSPKIYLLIPKNTPLIIWKFSIYALLRTPKRYKNIIKDVKVFYNIF